MSSRLPCNASRTQRNLCGHCTLGHHDRPHTDQSPRRHPDVRPRHDANQGCAVHRARPVGRPTRRAPSGISAERPGVAGRGRVVERCGAPDPRTARGEALPRDRHFGVGTRRRRRFRRPRRHRHRPAVVRPAPLGAAQSAERLANGRRARIELRRGAACEETVVRRQRTHSGAATAPRVVRKRLPHIPPDRPRGDRPQQRAGRAGVGRARARPHRLYEPGAARRVAVGRRRAARRTRRRSAGTRRRHSRRRRRARRHLRKRGRGRGVPRARMRSRSAHTRSFGPSAATSPPARSASTTCRRTAT